VRGFWRTLILCGLLAAFGVCASAQCPARPSAGFPVAEAIAKVPDGPQLAVWYPVVPDPDVQSGCERFPLIVFSHGFDGCGTQSRFLTEELARAGYVVAAPDHRDAACRVDAAALPRFHFAQVPFSSPGRWKDSTYADRRADLEKTLDWLLANPQFSGRIDPARIGAAGHSLGGYSVLGLAGGWDSWRDPRIAAVLAMSPYVKPFLVQDRMSSIRVPVMYQGAQFDLGITPDLRGDRGAAARSGGPTYYVELNHGSHFEWTNAACWANRQAGDCVRKRSNPRLIVEYAVAFFDRYLRQQSDPLQRLDGTGLRAYLTPSSKW
jgi:predicted dienelactone hydrolase